MKKIIMMSLFSLTVFSQSLFAHEHRKAGDYDLVVGFLNEPAFSGAMNGLDLRVSKEGKPVEGLENSFRAIVQAPDGKSLMTLKLRKRYKQPGAYAGYFYPTIAGKYSFQIAGTIESQSIDETFVSGPGTFHDVEDSTALRFPGE